MPLFGRQPPNRRQVLTINNRPQPQPEAPGSMPRRFRLFVECERRLADDPLAASTAAGRPVGDGLGLEGLVAKIAPLFARERSLIRWVVLRGAFADLYIRICDPESAAASPPDLEKAMGLQWTPDVQGQVHPDLALPWRTTLSAEQRQAALGVASSVLVRVDDYRRYSTLNVAEVNADPRCQLSVAVALDCIAWSAIALLRLGIAQQIIRQVPEPDALPDPGWYTDPLFAKSERYWDGADWTDQCRMNDGRQFIETCVPLA